MHNLCCNENKGATELVAELGTLYQCIRWVTKILTMSSFTALGSVLVQGLDSRDPLMIILVSRFPVVAMGVLKWVDWTVSEPSYFQLQTDHTPVHLALLDEVGRRLADGETPILQMK